MTEGCPHTSKSEQEKEWKREKNKTVKTYTKLSAVVLSGKRNGT